MMGSGNLSNCYSSRSALLKSHSRYGKFSEASIHPACECSLSARWKNSNSYRYAGFKFTQSHLNNINKIKSEASADRLIDLGQHRRTRKEATPK